MFQDFIQKFKDATAGIPQKSKILIGAMSVGILTLLILVLVWLNKPQYRVLYSGLSQADAGRIVEYLQEQSINYKYDHGGTTILVPTKQVFDVRMNLANEGIPNDGVVGYEIFDQTNFGMTEYVQEVNYKRALEGELQRTIQQMEEVESARVHLVIPEEALFREDESEPTAAIIVKLRTEKKLGPEQVEAMQHLVANSVEQLESGNVTIADATGNMLTEATGSRDVSQTSTQHAFQQKTEEYLAQKAQSMLDGVLGYGKSIVRVTADLSFERIEETREIYDPDNVIVRSEEIIENTNTTNPNPAGAINPNAPANNPNANLNPETTSSQEHTITNYEFNRTVQSIINEVGNIKRLNIAVLVDGTYSADENGTRVYQPRDPQEIARLERIVKAAVGYNLDRGDQFEISNVQFDMSELEEQERQLADMEKRQFWQGLISKVLSAGLVIFFILLLRNVIKRSRVIIGDIPFMGEGKQDGQGGEQLAEGEGDELPEWDIELSEEVTERAQLQAAIKRFSEKEPEQVTNLLRTWLVDSEE
ncbi:MAG TPA: flagellar basal-body MS-ring/collar protein FliF [bacterium]|nr:flagellar basal-body MS-ring/collar protein FliF [bacterium]